jgi:hypothetical protein
MIASGKPLMSDSLGLIGRRALVTGGTQGVGVERISMIAAGEREGHSLRREFPPRSRNPGCVYVAGTNQPINQSKALILWRRRESFPQY